MRESELGRLIRERRRELGMSQEELASQIDPPVRQTVVSAWETGQSRLPTPMNLRSLARVLNLDPGELLARSGWGTAGAVLKEYEDQYDFDQTADRQELMQMVRHELTETDVKSLLRIARLMARHAE